MSEFFKNIRKQDIQNVLAVIATIFAFTYLTALTFIPIPKENKEIVMTLSGVVLGGTVVLVFNFFYGNSKKQNDATKSEDQSN